MRPIMLKGEQLICAPTDAQWWEWFCNFDNRIVARTNICCDYVISTVCLGIRTSRGAAFETLISGNKTEYIAERYSSVYAARTEHNKIVERLFKERFEVNDKTTLRTRVKNKSVMACWNGTMFEFWSDGIEGKFSNMDSMLSGYFAVVQQLYQNK